jgi:hypothetical protein
MITTLIMLLAIQASDTQTVADDAIWKQTTLNKVAEINLPPNAVTGKWQVSPGIKINDLATLSDVPAASRQAAIAISKQLKPIGVSAVADYSLVSRGFPLNTITVRVFVFEDPLKCKAWWTKKYEHDGWEKFYSKAQCDSARVVRSTQTNKTAMAFGNVWLTTHQLGEGDEHITAANHVLNLLTNGVKSFPQESTETPVAPKVTEDSKKEAKSK